MQELKDAGSKCSANAITEIERIVGEARKSTILTAPQEPEGMYYLVGPDGKADLRTSKPDWLDAKLATPAELRRFIAGDEVDTSREVYLDESKVIYVQDVNDRRDLASCDLIQTPQYLWLTKQAGIALTQQELIRVLRITLRGCLPSDSTLLALIRNLKFQASQDGGVNIQHGRESLGKKIAAEVNADHEIPEEIPLMVPVFENFPFAHRVVCAIEILATDQKFKLTPYPLETRKAMDAALDAIEDLMGDDGMPPVYRGQP